ncbi:hypothetical protein AAG570_008300 [Ranatra chinensis]|uniref:Zinc finger PHD-type domain-containing protein n=1 Tax=Ranatra chinensis TaxID=642074 RepID=A0ABD0Y629_9HEMI
MKAHEFPDVQFLGSLQAVVSARTKYQQNLQVRMMQNRNCVLGWDEELTVIANLMKLCQLDGFLVKPTTNGASEDTGKECFICFADLVDGQPPPSKWCSNDKCSSYYHLPCLLEVRHITLYITYVLKQK